ncbi:MAG: hypothetical protein ABL956_11510 [Hyphomonadaceae bacterium]
MTARYTPLWAFGAIALAALIACVPPVAQPGPAEPAQPTPQPPVLSGETPTIGPPPANIDPGFVGSWAAVESACGDAARTVRLSAKTINLPPGEGNCAVKSIKEEHPGGRAMSYTIIADCVAKGRMGEDTFRINFGPSDTVVQFQENAREPQHLIRCPYP